jgi:hypothetical protein
VALVRMAHDKRFFGVAMRGGRYVVQLPLGYDGLTSVRWINGYIVVVHPQLPPLLADTTTGKTAPLEPAQYQQMLADVKRALGLSQRARVIH